MRLFPWSVQARSSLTLERDGRVVTLPEVSSQEPNNAAAKRTLPVNAGIEFNSGNAKVVQLASQIVDTQESV